MPNNKLIMVPVLCCIVLGMSGCNRTKVPGLKPAQGVVIYDSIPLAWATVAFVPKDASKGRQAATQTDAEGKFTLNTLGDAGILPGEYNVMVHRVIQDTGKNSLNNWKRERASGTKEPKPDPELRSNPNVKFIPVVPRKYLKPKSSGLDVTIPPQGDNNIRIELTG